MARKFGFTINFKLIAVILFVIHSSYSEFIVTHTETSFEVTVDGVQIISHGEGRPAFLISKIDITMSEMEGNFKINETVEKDQIPLSLGSVVHGSDYIWNITFVSPNDGNLTLDLWEGHLSDVETTHSFKLALINSDTNRIHFRVPSNAEEHIYGLGVQFSHFDLKGHKYTIWSREQGVGRNKSDPFFKKIEAVQPGTGGDHDYTYWPQATFTSSFRYTFVLNTPTYCIFDFESENYSEIQVHDKDFTGNILTAPTFFALVQKSSAVFGRFPRLPRWVHTGAILGVQGGTTALQRYAKQAEEKKVALAAMWIQDWSGKITTNFGSRIFWNWKWNSTWYPNLNNVIEDLVENHNVRVLAYINPHLNQDGDLFKEADREGYFLRYESNPEKTYLQDFGQFTCGTIDMWNPKATEWYKSIIKKNMVNLGFSGWMSDFGEYTPFDSVPENKTLQLSSAERHNLFPVLWAKLNREAADEADEDEILYWSRSGGLGATQYGSILWGGDQNVDWSTSDGLPSSITAALSSAMSGIGLYHFDIGGYTTNKKINLIRSKELFLRSAEYAVFTQMMRTHEGNQPEVNHQVYTDDDTWEQFARLTQMFAALANYSISIAKAVSYTGTPAMRPLFLHYENDTDSYSEKYEYLYGKDLLVAPVLTPGTVYREVYLPPDDWIHLWDTLENVHVGPIRVSVSAPMGHPPVFYRADSDWKDTFVSIRDTFVAVRDIPTVLNITVDPIVVEDDVPNLEFNDTVGVETTLDPNTTLDVETIFDYNDTLRLERILDSNNTLGVEIMFDPNGTVDAVPTVPIIPFKSTLPTVPIDTECDEYYDSNAPFIIFSWSLICVLSFTIIVVV